MNRIRNLFAFAQKLSFQKTWNALLVYSSFYFAKWFKKPVHWGLPISIAIEPTTSCNLRCPECPSGLRSFTRPVGMLQQENFNRIIDQVHKTTLYLTFYFQGEPYLNPHFLDMVNYASKKGVYTSTSTNAHYLNDENAKKTVQSGLDRLIISIDGASQEIYEQYRKGGDLSKVIEGTENIIRWKKRLKSAKPLIIFQFLVVKPNEHQIGEIKTIGKNLGVNKVKFKTAQLYDFENGNPLMPENPKYSRYQLNGDGKYHIKNNLDNHCWKLWHSTVITWDGRLIPCCFDKDANHTMGHLKEEGLARIWQNPAYRAFREKVLRSRKEIDICRNCSEGTKVWAD